MSKRTDNVFRRLPYAQSLRQRLEEPRRYIQAIAGPRQVGKTTMVLQTLEDADIPHLYVSADEPTLRDAAWLRAQWDRARLSARGDRPGFILALDEIHKIPDWSETVKALWDEDARNRLALKVVLLGSAPLLMQRGLGESLAGRFELLRLPHWSYTEMQTAFDFTFDQFLFFGGYPGAAAMVDDASRWRRYILDSLVETTLARDLLLTTRVDKPALLRRLFELGCRYSGQILSYTKMLGQLHDAGNTTTLAHYLDLLAAAGMLTGLQKYAGSAIRRRGSSPKLQVLNTGLMTAVSGLSPAKAREDVAFRGRLVESAVGAHLLNTATDDDAEVFYWRERNHEVDFVVQVRDLRLAIEVKSGRPPEALPGLGRFAEAFKPDRTLLVGGDGIPLEEFLSQPVSYWIEM